jgi:hypothetical protein
LTKLHIADPEKKSTPICNSAGYWKLWDNKQLLKSTKQIDYMPRWKICKNCLKLYLKRGYKGVTHGTFTNSIPKSPERGKVPELQQENPS